MDTTTTSTPSRTGPVPHLLGLVYVTLLIAATAGGIAASFATTSGMSCPDAPTTAAVILSCVTMAVLPALSLLPGLRERIHPAYRLLALIAPVTILVVYGAIMIGASILSAHGERPGSWSGLLMPIVYVAPIAALSGAAALATLTNKRRETLYFAIAGLLVVITSLVVVVAVIRSLSLCS